MSLRSPTKTQSRTASKRGKKLGLPPGSVVYVGAEREATPTISVIDYNLEHATVQKVESVEQVYQLRDTSTVSWINIDGTHDTTLIQNIATHFGLHPLTAEDIANTQQRPKQEEFPHYTYVVLKMLYFNQQHTLIEEQVSFVLSERFLITFQEQGHEGDVFNFVRERIRNNKGRIRSCGTDYLLYALIDSIVDYYFLILEELGDRVDQIEERLITDPREQILAELYSTKRSLLRLRRSVWPCREVLSALERGESPHIQSSTLVYLKDVYDHTVQVIDTVEMLRENLASLLEVYLSSISNRLNTVMKFLTLVATVFMPLTFIAGVYGMNFANMPELQWRYGYPAALTVMALVAAGMVIYFRRKRWI